MGMETEGKINITTFNCEHVQQRPFWVKLKWGNVVDSLKKRKKRKWRKKRKQEKLNSLISFDQLKKKQSVKGWTSLHKSSGTFTEEITR